jgi:hypothetical protein
MKIAFRSSLSRLDMEYDSDNFDNFEEKCFWQALKVEYWKELFENCGNVHPFRSAFAQRFSLEKRKFETLIQANKYFNTKLK